MIATQQLFFWGRKLEMELRVHVVRSESRDDVVTPSDAERAAEQARALREADCRNSHWQRVWLEQGSRW